MQSPLFQPLRLHYSTGLWPTNSSWWWSIWQKQQHINLVVFCNLHITVWSILHTHVCACALLVRSNLVNSSNFSFVFTGCSHWNRLGAVIFKTSEQNWCYWPELNYFSTFATALQNKMYKSINTPVKIVGQVYKRINHK